MPGIEQEVLRLLPFLHKKFKGICVYVPTPQVSMIDLTLQLENDHGDTLYRLVYFTNFSHRNLLLKYFAEMCV